MPKFLQVNFCVSCIVLLPVLSVLIVGTIDLLYLPWLPHRAHRPQGAEDPMASVSCVVKAIVLKLVIRCPMVFGLLYVTIADGFKLFSFSVKLSIVGKEVAHTIGLFFFCYWWALTVPPKWMPVLSCCGSYFEGNRNGGLCL